MIRQLVCSILTGISVFVGAAGTVGAQAGQVSTHTLEYQGITRTYTLYMPPSAQADAAVPLVIALHGGGGSGEGFMAYTDFNTHAEMAGFAVVYPDAVGERWHDGREIDNLGVDDVGLIAALIDTLAADYPVDKERVFVTGMSNGGFMTATLACVRPELFAGIAIITASIPELLIDNCAAAPMPALILNGTADPLVPYDGGEVNAGGVARGVASSTDATIAFWREINGCDSEPDAVETLDNRSLDGTSVDFVLSRTCKSGMPVTLVRVAGGGHTLPGTRPYLPRAIIGTTSREFSGAAFIIAFFAQASG
jgi:polyhydroxybutyrate depolymerase